MSEKHSEIGLEFELLGQLYFNLERSKIAYQSYLKNDKIFLFARVLMESNQTIRGLLIEKGFLLSPTLFSDALLLIAHYDVWIQKWLDLEQKNKPNLSEVFVFENEFTFPKNAAQNIERAFFDLKNKAVQ